MNILLSQQVSAAKNSIHTYPRSPKTLEAKMIQTIKREVFSKSITERSAGVLNAIIVLARTYHTANSLPTKYAKYGYDFPEMIKAKMMNLEEINCNDFWVSTLSGLLLKSLDSPEEIINICMQYLREMHEENMSFVR